MKVQKTRKETIIDKLLEEKTITPLEAAELLKDDYKAPYSPVIPIPQQPYIPFPQQPYMPLQPVQEDWRQKWVSEEMTRRARIADACPCNPKNGGSGMCGCSHVGPTVMC